MTDAPIPLHILHCEICGFPRGVYGAAETGGFCVRCTEAVQTHVLVVEVHATENPALIRRTGRIFAISRTAYETRFPKEAGTVWRQADEAWLRSVLPESAFQ